MTAHSSQASAPSEGGGNADTEVRASLSDGTVTSEDLPPALLVPAPILRRALLALELAWANMSEEKDAVAAVIDDARSELKRHLGWWAEHCMCIECRDGNLHASHCAVHNMPAMANGHCNCGAPVL